MTHRTTTLAAIGTGIVLHSDDENGGKSKMAHKHTDSAFATPHIRGHSL